MAGKSANSRSSDRNRGGSYYGPSTQGFLGAAFVSGKAKEHHTFTNAQAALGLNLQASGGDVADTFAPGNGYAYHTFSQPGSFTVSGGTGNIEILIVGGGGAGGYRISGGGGAGGLLYGTIYVQAGETYTVEVGRGGAYHDGTELGGEPSNFYRAGTSFPNPPNYARAYGGGSGGGYALSRKTPVNPGTTLGAPTPGDIGAGADGGSGGGAGGQYGTGGFPGFTSRVFTSPQPTTPQRIGAGTTQQISPITPNSFSPWDPTYLASLGDNGYGSDAPVTNGSTHPSGYSQGQFPSTYYMGLQGYGNPGGMTYGPSLNGGGAGGGGAGGAGQDMGSAPNTSAPNAIRAGDGGPGRQYPQFNAPLICDPSQPNGASVKTALDPLGAYFAGGGGGSNYTTTQGAAYGGGRGGDGGGGNGTPNSSSTGNPYTSTTFNTPPNGYSSPDHNGVHGSGGGGGGDGYSHGSPDGGDGGSGIVVLRYAYTG